MDQIPYTYLKIDGLAPLGPQARNISFDHKLIEEGGRIVRLASGVRRSLRRSQFNKYSISISGEGRHKPAISHLNKGDVVVIECPGYFHEPGEVALANLKRPPVDGSLTYAGGVEMMGSWMLVTMQPGDPRITTTIYRPVMTVMLDSIDVNYRDAEANGTWSINGEEV